MGVYVRHETWLSLTPEGSKQTRRESLQASGSNLTALPDIEGGAYLVELLWEVGPCKPAAMGGHIPIDEIDLLAWRLNTGDNLTLWETRTIKYLSREVVGMLSIGKGKDVPPPYAPKPVESVRASVSDRFDAWAKGRKNGPIQHRRTR